MKKNILIVAPHPDDETLGCGGTVLKFKEDGHKLYWVLVTEPKEEDGFSPSFIEMRKNEIKSVKEAYDFDGFFQLPFPALRLDTIPLKDIVQALGEIVRSIEADTIFLPFGGDVHSDHQVVFAAGSAVSKTFRYPTVKEVYLYETVSETELSPNVHNFPFVPDTFVEITPHLERKLEIMALYSTESGKHPFPRSDAHLRALALHRGTIANVEYAEAFKCLKRIIL